MIAQAIVRQTLVNECSTHQKNHDDGRSTNNEPGKKSRLSEPFYIHINPIVSDEMSGNQPLCGTSMIQRQSMSTSAPYDKQCFIFPFQNKCYDSY